MCQESHDSGDFCGASRVFVGPLPGWRRDGSRPVSGLERRSDMLLSTLKRFVQATGGELHIVVSYPGGGPVELLVEDQ